MWDFIRPFAWSAIRHGVTTAAAYLAAKGILVDDATVNGVSTVAMQGVDLLVAGGLGATASVATSALKGVPSKLLGMLKGA